LGFNSSGVVFMQNMNDLMPLAFCALILGTLAAACCLSTARADDIGSKIADRADLAGMDLSQMDLSGAHLNQSDLSAANLSGTNLRGAFMRSAWLMNAALRGTNMDLSSRIL
jgi:uncharacterized protein YjbI with pentapeptide repeats